MEKMGLGVEVLDLRMNEVTERPASPGIMISP